MLDKPQRFIFECNFFFLKIDEKVNLGKISFELYLLTLHSVTFNTVC